MSQYKNVNEFLATIGFSMPMTPEQYKAEKKAVIVCPRGHRKELAKTSLQNKISMFRRGEVDQFCGDCLKESEHAESEEKYTRLIEEKTGHIVLEVDVKTRNVVYECGSCGEKAHSNTGSLIRQNIGYCKSCENSRMKLTYSDLKRKVEEMGAQLLTQPEEYTNNKMLLSIICSCGKEDKKALSDIRKGKKCKNH
jgi:hypothetical protein